MHFFKTSLVVGLLCAASIAPGYADSKTVPTGQFKDSYGTAFKFSPCGSGTDLCGVLLDIQGQSRTKENLALVQKQVVKAEQVSDNQWKGTVELNGSVAQATITQVSADQVEIQGCRAAILCQTLVFKRV
ncbi:hypothetical protein [Devosia sp. FKR38]|uniref:hypothetical protein n=1 Tax=Devosia sp. FKR38 TaxID=2562312 RepID=UPI0010BFB118|nr:hypothetical protein [Devosia sp. FKR38]